MSPEEALGVADAALIISTSKPLTDTQRMILQGSLADRGYESMSVYGYTSEHIKNEGAILWKLLSQAFGEKVGKKNFRGALEKRLRSGAIAPKSPTPLTYNPQTWVGRKLVVELLAKLQGQTRLLWITGISGIGKTTLGECLASKAWDNDPSFQWIYLEVLEGQDSAFTTIAAELLTKLGEKELDPQERNDPKRLIERLLRKLQANRYWIQLDALERLLNPGQPTEFTDAYWQTFLQRCLTEPILASRLVLTSQALPTALAEFNDRYPNHWHEITLRGLSVNEQHNEHLEFFSKKGITVDESNQPILNRIGWIYEGHPLVLQVIAKEMLASPFQGNVATYWQRYSNEFEQVARELQTERLYPALYNQALQRQVRQRVEISLKRLPTDALDLLCRSSVYRRPVPETFWFAMISDRTPAQQEEAYRVLCDRALVEKEGIHQGQFLIRQHNLIRDVTYSLLKYNLENWQVSENMAGQQWLCHYKSDLNDTLLEQVRDKIEAFYHCCEAIAWQSAKRIFYVQNELIYDSFHNQLGIWGYYHQQMQIYSQYLKLTQRIDVQIAFPKDSVQGKWAALHGLGNAYHSLGHYSQAIEYYQQALTTTHKVNNRVGEGLVLGGLGNAHHSLGQYSQAIEYYQQALTIFQEGGDLSREIGTLANLAETHSHCGHYIQATKYLNQALTLNREIGDLKAEASILCSLGNLHYFLGENTHALDYYQQHLKATQKLGDRGGEGRALGQSGQRQ